LWLLATISENSASDPQTFTTRTERVIEAENDRYGETSVRTASGWHFVDETSSLGPRVPFSDDRYYMLVKRVTVSVADEDAPAEAAAADLVDRGRTHRGDAWIAVRDAGDQ
jgi:hypothetical protein